MGGPLIFQQMLTEWDENTIGIQLENYLIM